MVHCFAGCHPRGAPVLFGAVDVLKPFRQSECVREHDCRALLDALARRARYIHMDLPGRISLLSSWDVSNSNLTNRPDCKTGERVLSLWNGSDNKIPSGSFGR